jgi:glycosyltransferase involved in cell wall biosynthesis
VIGEQFRDVPEVFAWAKEFFAGQIVRWGYQPTRDAYRAALTDADVVVSTARHEFFGLSITEAIAAGAYPLLPKRLAYPEILDTIAPSSTQQYFYDGTVDHLAQRLAGLSRQLQQPTFELAEKAANMYGWPTRAPALDDALQAALTAKS